MYMYKQDMALNDLQRLICHETKPNHCKRESEYAFVDAIIFKCPQKKEGRKEGLEYNSEQNDRFKEN